MDVSALCTQLRQEAEQIGALPKTMGSFVSYGYFDALEELRKAFMPVAEAIKNRATAAGFRAVELFAASPKSHVQKLVFAVADPESGRIERLIPQVLTATNSASIDPSRCAWTAGQEQANFSGRKGQLLKVAVLSDSDTKISHSVKGLWIAIISPQQASELTLEPTGDKPERQLSLADYATSTDALSTEQLRNAGFDQNLLARYLEAYNNDSEANPVGMQLSRKTITQEDIDLAQKTQTWLASVEVQEAEMMHVVRRLKALSFSIAIPGKCAEDWRAQCYQGAVREAAQKIIDSVASRWFPTWSSEDQCEQANTRQVKVQAAQSIRVNGQLLPSWLTHTQLAVMQAGASAELEGRVVHIASMEVTDEGQVVNIVTEIV